MLKEQLVNQLDAARVFAKSDDGMIAIGAGAVTAAAMGGLAAMATTATVAKVATVGGLIAIGTLTFGVTASVAKGLLIGFRSLRERPMPIGERRTVSL